LANRGMLTMALSALALWCAGAAADITVDEARSLAARVTGYSLEAAEVKESPNDIGRMFYEFVLRDAKNLLMLTCWVDAVQGVVTGWTEAHDARLGDREPCQTADAALVRARNLSRRALGPDADRLAWTARPHGEDTWRVEGDGGPAGDPPRTGLTPMVLVDIELNGRVRMYSQIVPDGGPPIPTGVPLEAATAAAAKQLGIARAELQPQDTPRLRQRWGRLCWDLRFRDADAPLSGGRQRKDYPHYATVDAVTGEVLWTDRTYGGMSRSDAAYTPTFPPPRPPVAARAGLGAAGIVVVVGIAALVVRRFRRTP